MSDNKGPPKLPSGEHEAVIAFRKKLDSIDEFTLPAIAATNKRFDAALSDAPPSLPPAEELRGSWVVTIRGTGPHHNMRPGDANRLTARFVRMLRESGQEVHHASFANGSEESVHDDPDARNDEPSET